MPVMVCGDVCGGEGVRVSVCVCAGLTDELCCNLLGLISCCFALAGRRRSPFPFPLARSNEWPWGWWVDGWMDGWEQLRTWAAA